MFGCVIVNQLVKQPWRDMPVCIHRSSSNSAITWINILLVTTILWCYSVVIANAHVISSTTDTTAAANAIINGIVAMAMNDNNNEVNGAALPVIYVSHNGYDIDTCGSSFSGSLSCATIDYALRYRINYTATATMYHNNNAPTIGVMVSSQPYTCPPITLAMNHSINIIGLDDPTATSTNTDARVFMDCRSLSPAPFQFTTHNTSVIIHRFTFMNMVTSPRLSDRQEQRKGSQYGGVIFINQRRVILSAVNWYGNQGGAMAYLHNIMVDEDNDEHLTSNSNRNRNSNDDHYSSGVINNMVSLSSLLRPAATPSLYMIHNHFINNSIWCSADTGITWSSSIALIRTNTSYQHIFVDDVHWRDNYVLDHYVQMAIDVTFALYGVILWLS
jgi:hypothetical protein